jgi:maltooligosyltrehalose trehalohydrolase
MLFAGQEFAASSRFHYFTDHNEELGRAITEGRRTELAQSGAYIDPEIQVTLPDPQASETFLESKLNLMERHEGVGEQMFALYRELIALRRNDRVLQRQDRGAMRAVAASDQLLLVHMARGDEQRLIVLNTGVAIDATPEAAGVPADIARLLWQPLISTEERRFGGTNDQVRFDEGLIALPPQSATFFAASAPSQTGRLSIRGRVSRLIARFRRR